MNISKISVLANDLANRALDAKCPYSTLKWIVENCDWQYKASKDELWQAYFAAINILKQSGVENAKRKPLSVLSKTQRQRMRKQAKELASIMQKILETPVKVSRSPIKSYENGDTIIYIQVHLDRFGYRDSWANFGATFEQLSKWANLDDATRYVKAAQFAERYKTRDQHISENVEIIRANLDALL